MEDYSDNFLAEDIERSRWQRTPLWLRLSGSLIVASALLVGSFELVYAGRIYPGVTSQGVNLGGSSQIQAAKQLRDKASEFSGQVVSISHDNTVLRIPVDSLKASYETDHAADLAYAYGRQGSWGQRLTAQLRALTGRTTVISASSFEADRLTPYIVDLSGDILTPSLDASLNFNGGKPEVTPAQVGARLDYGQLVHLVASRIDTSSTDTITAPVYDLSPSLSTSALQAVTDQLGSYVSGPITLKYSGTTTVIPQKTIISWIQVGAMPVRNVMDSGDIKAFYPPAATASLGLSKTAIQKYVAELAEDIDQTAKNATLSMVDGQLAITAPSRTGIKVDQAAAISAITDSLKQTDNREVDLKLAVTQADVNETNLDSLGIKEEISEGETYFPGSPSTRLTNVRAGARRFNGVLLKPGETFSFGALLGDVGPETGYVPELVILGDHEEKQYGGGLCQVSSTAFRAALAAGLPITERVNHAFAISYYTWPYSAPGVDATIYYPSVDFKFVNDTGHYILMQTVMNGTDLKFFFYGTKTKSGVVRGPNFVTGSSDATQPSHTVFYRDVLDLAGNVVKTDKFDTYYKSSKDFPITKQFN